MFQGQLNVPGGGGRQQGGPHLLHQKPFHGHQPQPVYQPGGGLMASGSHNIENAVEYGPEITGPQAGTFGSQQPPHSPPQGAVQPAPQFNTQGRHITVIIHLPSPLPFLSFLPLCTKFSL